MTVLLCT